jgi:hypothetical protein
MMVMAVYRHKKMDLLHFTISIFYEKYSEGSVIKANNSHIDVLQY